MQTACVRPPRSTLSFVITEGSLDRDPCAQAIEDEGADEWLDALRESREAARPLRTLDLRHNRLASGPTGDARHPIAADPRVLTAGQKGVGQQQGQAPGALRREDSAPRAQALSLC